jgi:dUTPase
MPGLELYFEDPAVAALYSDRAVCQENYRPDLGACPDSGFDLICLEEKTLKAGEQAKFDFQVRGVMWETVCGAGNFEQLVRVGYFLVPRSSFNDTPLVMQNSPGVIDSAYNGTIRMKVRALADFTIPKGTCLGQLVHPSLRPFSVRIIEGTPPATHRGDGGFGSTGNTAPAGNTHVAV